jgi:hypothetical protein
MAHNRTAISDEDLAHYVRSYALPAQLRAGLEIYRHWVIDEQPETVAELLQRYAAR